MRGCERGLKRNPGTTYQPAALQAFLQGDVAANDASTKARANWRATVKVANSTDSASAALTASPSST